LSRYFKSKKGSEDIISELGVVNTSGQVGLRLLKRDWGRNSSVLKRETGTPEHRSCIKGHTVKKWNRGKTKKCPTTIDKAPKTGLAGRTDHFWGGRRGGKGSERGGSSFNPNNASSGKEGKVTNGEGGMGEAGERPEGWGPGAPGRDGCGWG